MIAIVHFDIGNKNVRLYKKTVRAIVSQLDEQETVPKDRHGYVTMTLWSAYQKENREISLIFFRGEETYRITFDSTKTIQKFTFNSE